MNPNAAFLGVLAVGLVGCPAEETATTVAEAVCGDGECAPAEGCDSCVADCACSAQTGTCLATLDVCAECASVADCDAGETCVGGSCSAAPDRCGDGTCDLDEGCASCAADCGCGPSASQCLTDLDVCVTCVSGGDCDSGDTCVGGACQKAPELCGNGSCDPDEGCASCAGDCACTDEASHCLSDLDACAACRTNDDCNEGDICAGGGCQTGPVLCGNTICDPGEGCDSCAVDCACADAAPHCVSELDVCVVCRGNDDCNTGEVCTGGSCQTGPVPCGNAICEPELGEGCSTCATDCACGASASHCVSGLDVCVACVSDDDCGDADRCVGGSCEPAPLSCGNNTCEPQFGEGCASCAADCACLGDADHCLNDLDVCVGCVSDGDCAESEQCVGGGCVTAPVSCGNDTCEPDLGEGCASCAADCGCDGDTSICLTDLDVCVACAAGTDCEADEVCIAGACQPASVLCGNSSCDPGEGCESCAEDCGCEGDSPLCLTGTDACVACIYDSDCPTAGVCSAGVCGHCGDTVCNAEAGEDCGSCASDCCHAAKRYSTAIDFLDMVWLRTKPESFATPEQAYYTEAEWRGFMAYLKVIGIRRVYFRVSATGLLLYPSAIGKVYAGDGRHPQDQWLVNTLATYDPLQVTIDAGRELGIQVYAWLTLYDEMGTVARTGPGSADFETYGAFPGSDPWFESYPEGYWQPHPDLAVSRYEPGATVTEIDLLTPAWLPAIRGPREAGSWSVVVWTSENGVNFTRYTGPITQGPATSADDEFIGHKLRGLQIRAPYIKLTHDPDPMDLDFTIGGPLDEVVRMRGTTAAGDPVDDVAVGVDWLDSNPDPAFSPFPRSFGTDRSIAFDAGERVLILAVGGPVLGPGWGMPSYGNPDVDAYKASIIAELLDSYTLPGIALSLRTHSLIGQPNAYDFSPHIAADYADRAGSSILDAERYDASLHRQVQANFLTAFLGQVVDAHPSRDVIAMANKPITAPRTDEIYMAYYGDEAVWDHPAWHAEAGIAATLVQSGHPGTWDDAYEAFLDTVMQAAGGERDKVLVHYDYKGPPLGETPANFDAFIERFDRSEHARELEFYEAVQLVGPLATTLRHYAIDWHYGYEATALPAASSPQWVAAGGGGSSVTDGILTIDAETPGDTRFFQIPAGPVWDGAAGPWTVEVRCRVATPGLSSGAASIQVADGTYAYNFRLTSSGVVSNGQTVAVDTSIFHRYRVVLEGGRADLYIDHALALSVPGVAVAVNRLMFGDVSSAEAAITEWDFVRWLPGAHRPDAQCSADTDCAGSGTCVIGQCEEPCGNGVCQPDEGCASCAADCGCVGDASICLTDLDVCVACTFAGDCDAGETCIAGTCEPVSALCGNGACDAGEGCNSCAADCACDDAEPYCLADADVCVACRDDVDCGGGVCTSGVCGHCGDTLCNEVAGEDCGNCAADCCPASKRYSTTIDFYDNCYDGTIPENFADPSEAYYTEAQWRAFLAKLKADGIQRIYYRISAGGTVSYHSDIAKRFAGLGPLWPDTTMYLANTLAHYDPLAVAVDAAKELGLQIYGWVTLFDDHGASVSNLAGDAGFDEFGAFPFADPYFADNPELYWQPHPDLATPSIEAGTVVTEIDIVASAEFEGKPPRDDGSWSVALWTSVDGINFAPYPLPGGATQGAATFEADGFSGYTFGGLDIDTPFIKIVHDPADLGTGNEWFIAAPLQELVKLRGNSPSGQGVPLRQVTELLKRVVDPSWSTHPPEQANLTTAFDYAERGLRVTLGGQVLGPAYGMPSYGQPAVDDHKAAIIHEMLSYGLSGTVLSIRTHSNFPSADAYDFSPHIADEYAMREGRSLFDTDSYDSTAHRQVQADFLTAFLARLADDNPSKELIMMTGVPDAVGPMNTFMRLYTDEVIWDHGAWLADAGVAGVMTMTPIQPRWDYLSALGLAFAAFIDQLVTSAGGDADRLTVHYNWVLPGQSRLLRMERFLEEFDRNERVRELQFYEAWNLTDPVPAKLLREFTTPWQHGCEALERPEEANPAWTPAGAAANTASLSDGVLTIDAMTDPGATGYYQIDAGSTWDGASGPWTVQVRFRAASVIPDRAAASIQLGDGTRIYNFQFGADSVTSNGVSAAVDTSVFHRYRIVLEDGRADLYVNDPFIKTGSRVLLSSTGLEHALNRLVFGDISGNEAAVTEWDYVRWLPGAHRPPPECVIDDDCAGFSTCETGLCEPIPTVCGDTVCHDEGGETCTSCASDCCHAAKRYSTGIDFLDMAWADTRPGDFASPEVAYYTEAQWRAFIGSLANTGMTRIYYRVSACGKLMYPSEIGTVYTTDGRDPFSTYVANTLTHYDPIEVMVDEAKALGLQPFAWLTLFDEGCSSFRYSSGTSGFDQYGAFPMEDPFFAARPYLYWQPHPTLAAPRFEPGTVVTDIDLVAGAYLNPPRNPRAEGSWSVVIWESDDGENFTPYAGPAGTQANAVRAVDGFDGYRISGVALTKPYFKLTHDPAVMDAAWMVGGELAELIRLRGVRPDSSIVDLDVATDWLETNPDPSFSVHPINFDGDTRVAFDTGERVLIGVVGGKVLPPGHGMPSYGHPEVDAYKASVIAELLSNYDLGGVALSVRSHSRFSSPDGYDFSAHIAAEYYTRTGQSLFLPTAYQPEVHRQVQADFLTGFLKRVVDENPGKHVTMMANMPITEPRTDVFWMWLFGESDLIWDHAAWVAHANVAAVMPMTPVLPAWDEAYNSFIDSVLDSVGGDPRRITIHYDWSLPGGERDARFRDFIAGFDRDERVREFEFYEAQNLRILNANVIRNYAVPWAHGYEATELPADATNSWGSSISGGATVSSSDGILTVDTPTGADAAFFQIVAGPEWDGSQGPVTVEARCRVAAFNGSANAARIRVADGTAIFDFELTTTGVKSGSQTAPVDTSVFHRYRIVMQAGGADLYVDLDPTPVLSGTPVPFALNYLVFGDLSSAEAGTVDWDFIRWAPGAYRPE